MSDEELKELSDQDLAESYMSLVLAPETPGVFDSERYSAFSIAWHQLREEIVRRWLYEQGIKEGLNDE